MWKLKIISVYCRWYMQCKYNLDCIFHSSSYICTPQDSKPPDLKPSAYTLGSPFTFLEAPPACFFASEMFDVTARSSSSSPAPALCYSRWACRHGCHDVFSDEKFLKNMCNMKNLDEISRDICQFMDKKGACHNSTLLLKTVGRLAPFQFKEKGYLSCDPFHVITGSHWLSCRVGNSRLSARGLKTQSHCPLAASCISI